MRPLTVDDLMPLDEFASRRREFFDAHIHYLDRYRRVRIGPRVTLLFENRQTLWFRTQELLRICRLAEPYRVQQELDVYNTLLPERGHLNAALLIDIEDEAQLSKELAFWRTLSGENLCLQLSEKIIPAMLVTCRPEDRCIGASHWVQFVLDESDRKLLADFRHSGHFKISHETYRHDAPLGDDVRQSLVEDLELSENDPLGPSPSVKDVAYASS